MPQIISKTPSSSCPPSSPCCSHFRCILLGVLVLVVGLSAGLYIGGQGSSSPSSSVNQPSSQKAEVKKGSYEDGYQAALEFARKKLADKGMFVSSSKSGKNMLSRVAVKSVSGNSITVEFDASLLDIFSEGTITRTITVPDTVKIEKRTPKDPEEVQKAFDEFRKQQELLKNANTPEDMKKDFPTPPMPYTVENINISDLKAGDLLNIYCQVDAAKPDTFTAISVEFNNDQLSIQKMKDLKAPTDMPAPVPAKEDAVKNIPADTTPPSPEAEAAAKDIKAIVPTDSVTPPSPEAEAAAKDAKVAVPADTTPPSPEAEAAAKDIKATVSN